MKVPDLDTCLRLLSRYDVPDNIRMHCGRVAQVALALASCLNTRGAAINVRLVVSSALLHDIMKWQSISRGGDHAVMGYELLAGLGYPEVADLVRQHVYLDDPKAASIGEAQILNYADKRVLHSRVVSLDERMDDLLVRYGKTREIRARIRQGFKVAREIENRISTLAGCEPGRLIRLNMLEPDRLEEDATWLTNLLFGAIPLSGSRRRTTSGSG